MPMYINLREYTKRKYCMGGLINGMLALLTLYPMNWLYRWTGWDVPLAVFGDSPLSFPDIAGTMVALYVFGYMLAYVHERIPHCASPRTEACVRFAGMIVMFMLPVTYMFLNPHTLVEYLYWLDFTAALTVLPSVATVVFMYRFSGKTCSATTTS